MTVIYAVEAWVLSLLGWGWLAAQELLGWSLLSAQVFYGFMVLSTCNLVAVGIWPGSVGPRSGYFSAVVAFSLYTLGCTLDTLLPPSLSFAGFDAPFATDTGAVQCTFQRTQQLFYFSSSSGYVLQAAATLGYVIVQLLVAGAGMVDSSRASLWPGPAWGLALCMLITCRMIVMFDGTPKGLLYPGRYVHLFSRPLVEHVSVLSFFLYFLGALLGVEGILFSGLAWRKGARYVSFVGVVLFFVYVLILLGYKGMLGPSSFVLLLLVLAVSVVGLVDAVMIVAPVAPVVPPQAPPPVAPPVVPYPIQYTPSVYVNPLQTSVPPGRSRFFIPSAVEMAREKNKGV